MLKKTRPGHQASREDADTCALGRRTLIQGLAVSGCLAATGYLVCSPAESAQDARSSKPQPGDQFVFMTGDKEGHVVVPDDVKVGEAPLLVYPKDPGTEKILASRGNLLMLMRVNADDLDPSTKPHAAEGIVAYSAICTHEGCPISGQHENPRMAICNCHGSTFDIGNNGKVVQGPATRRLAMLPVTITDGTLVVAGKLNGPIGPPV
ncbi:Rieske (2Fe-2S) protein [Hyphomicrobium sp.]|uniref:QcrA and Rieske domain-containing protein n=1 Tax=Hyphomicrobium sp. TaxID=82 RepID=UPI0025B82E30|nr:Rieske (2Fe-2S) protein [Hyphomicrobium sp.]MCC7253959.1 Rieske 2Fe-2S domain-containing protein [Hyphomicrobium sp.]